MGANEKHAATYHGREYTPATENVEHSYVAYRSSKVDLITGHHEFTRWLEAVRAEAKAEALEEASYEIDQIDIDGDTALWIGPEQKYTLVSDWLRERSDWHRNQTQQLKAQS